MADSSTHNDILSTKWNSFFRIDVINETSVRQMTSILSEKFDCCSLKKSNNCNVLGVIPVQPRIEETA